jgi:hypothetical protein
MGVKQAIRVQSSPKRLEVLFVYTTNEHEVKDYLAKRVYFPKFVDIPFFEVRGVEAREVEPLRCPVRRMV